MKKILIVDDEELIRWGLSRAVGNAGSFDKDIKTVANADDAAAEIDSCEYDLCFLDIHIPGGDGLELMRRARQVSPRTKVVMMTSHDLDEATKEEIQKNAYHFFPKPFDIPQVRDVVEKALGGDNPPL